MCRIWLLLVLIGATPAFAGCPPEGQSRESLQALKALKFTLPDPPARQTLAEGLVDCLGDPDPELRDGLAYEALTHWMRAKELSPEGLRVLRDRLQAMLGEEDPAGFRRPFAALVLSEVARTDRVEPWMEPGERAEMVDAAARYLESVRDYRGYDEEEGWRHGVAHGADWLMQLTLNPALERAQFDRILAAIATQVVPEPAHAYVFGEPGRLARPVLYIAKRGVYSEAEWQAWLSAMTPTRGDTKLTYKDAVWLARRHDLLAFLTSLYLEADQSEDAQIRALKPAIVAALKTIW
ncbi:DUF2785 domain-containing protein [Lysobacter sp. CFH 32150]|uniref:DUF2785 domain-containing protein n=1 Tax=Lysobacter sp. CFH 32150 TaxID=2927128 RepID=UPI001FA725ED|nr:DUF2785 domain-containing protein [Lysobacter sp. CFH 32150]MCI4569361.1 DUF2785 domain-containing protein [Lysobacter sp. CFH 32150]